MFSIDGHALLTYVDIRGPGISEFRWSFHTVYEVESLIWHVSHISETKALKTVNELATNTVDGERMLELGHLILF